MRKYNLKNGYGITLIALVVTIVVLLILAGISVSMLTGQNGILNRASEAKEKTSSGQKQEKTNLANMEELINEKIAGKSIEQVNDDNPGVLEQENENIYVINSIEDLVFFSYDVRNGNTYEGKTVKLGTSLDFNSVKSYSDAFRTDYGKYGYDGELKTLLTSGDGFMPIGSINDKNVNTNYFKGIFDGGYNAIYHLYQNFEKSDIVAIYGLFGTNDGKISKLNVKEISANTVTNNMYVLYGGIAGRNNGTIEECSVSGKITHTSNGEKGSYIGGLSGQNFGIIQTSYSKTSIDIIGNDNKKQTLVIGGISGGNYQKIQFCYNTGNVTVNTDNIESLSISGIAQGENISNSYNIGDICKKGKNKDEGSAQKVRISGIGGIKENTSNYNIGNINIDTSQAGYATGIGCVVTDSATFNNCYNIGKIVSTGKNIMVGALTGWTTNQTIENCKWLKGTADKGIANKGASVNDTTLVMVENIADMPNVLDVIGDNFIEDSKNINGGYPILKWQKN